MKGMVEARKWEDDMMVRRLEKCGGDAAPTPLRERRALYPVLVLRTRL